MKLEHVCERCELHEWIELEGPAWADHRPAWSILPEGWSHVSVAAWPSASSSRLLCRDCVASLTVWFESYPPTGRSSSS